MANYAAQQNPDGTFTIFDVPVFGEMPKGEKGLRSDIDEAWLASALARGTQRYAEGYRAPVHVNHHGEGKDTPRVGFLRLRRVGKLKYGGETIACLFADLESIDRATFDAIQAQKLPYRSVEILNVKEPEIDSLALMDDAVPHFRFPNLSVKLRGDATTADTSFESPRLAAMAVKAGMAVCMKLGDGESIKAASDRIFDKDLSAVSLNLSSARNHVENARTKIGPGSGGYDLELARGAAQDAIRGIELVIRRGRESMDWSAAIKEPAMIKAEAEKKDGHPAEAKSGGDAPPAAPKAEEGEKAAEAKGEAKEEGMLTKVANLLSMIATALGIVQPNPVAAAAPGAAPTPGAPAQGAPPAGTPGAGGPPGTTEPANVNVKAAATPPNSPDTPSPTAAAPTSVKATPEQRAEVDALRAAARAREAKDTREALIAKAKADLDGYFLDAETVKDIEAFAAEGEAPLSRFVAAFRRTATADGPRTLAEVEMGPTSDEPAVLAYATRGPDYLAAARDASAEYDLLRSRTGLRLTREAFIRSHPKVASLNGTTN